MKRTFMLWAAAVLVVAGCSSDRAPEAESSAPVSDAPVIHKPADTVTFEDGVKFRLTGWGTYHHDDGVHQVADYTVLYGQAENTGPDMESWDPMASYVPEGGDSVDYTILDELESGVEGVFRSGKTADLSWGFQMPADALKAGTLTLWGSENWFGDFTTLPERKLTPAPAATETTTEAPVETTVPTTGQQTFDGPALGSFCPHSDLNTTTTSSTGETVRCLSGPGGYSWQIDTGVTQEDPAIRGQGAWADCIAAGNSPAECREIVDGG
ncbi:hypothetical protein SEA_BEARBQ_48 [Gordonia phage BearBQ]|nr:hypothetical protein SEA_BEARBQ_48 [Gordonia phage BearBQ]